MLLTERLVAVGWQGVLCEGTGSQLPSPPVPRQQSLPGPIRCFWQSPPGDRQGPRWPQTGRDKALLPQKCLRNFSRLMAAFYLQAGRDRNLGRERYVLGRTQAKDPGFFLSLLSIPTFPAIIILQPSLFKDRAFGAPHSAARIFWVQDVSPIHVNWQRRNKYQCRPPKGGVCPRHTPQSLPGLQCPFCGSHHPQQVFLSSPGSPRHTQPPETSSCHL